MPNKTLRRLMAGALTAGLLTAGLTLPATAANAATPKPVTLRMSAWAKHNGTVDVELKPVKGAKTVKLYSDKRGSVVAASKYKATVSYNPGIKPVYTGTVGTYQALALQIDLSRHQLGAKTRVNLGVWASKAAVVKSVKADAKLSTAKAKALYNRFRSETIRQGQTDTYFEVPYGYVGENYLINDNDLKPFDQIKTSGTTLGGRTWQITGTPTNWTISATDPATQYTYIWHYNRAFSETRNAWAQNIPGWFNFYYLGVDQATRVVNANS